VGLILGGEARLYGAAMELVELTALSEQDWAELIAGEQEPWGATGEELQWRDKDRHVGLRTPDGSMAAAGGAVIVEVDVEAVGGFDVVGIGGVFVTGSLRGQGLTGRLLPMLMGMAETMGPDRAMLFCRPELVGLYARHGFAEIAAPVWADQPDGRIMMPMRAMWRALRPATAWPPGRVDVRGLPF
jgi:predicted GNAT family N-acyltransferase